MQYQKRCIYLTKCPCELAYIGKTTRSLKTRIAEHRSNTRLKVERNPVAVHFNALTQQGGSGCLMIALT